MSFRMRDVLVGVVGTAAGIGKGIGQSVVAGGRAIAAGWSRPREPEPESVPLPPPLPPDPERLHVAGRPQELTRQAWWEVVRVIYADVARDRLFLVAAGVAFYVLLSIFPAISALVSIYGLFADAKVIVNQMTQLAFVLPPGAFDIIRGQADTIASATRPNLSLLAIGSTLLALWSANAGMKSMFEAMNIIYAEEEKRSFLRLNAQSFLFTLGAFGVFIAVVAMLIVLPLIFGLVQMQERFWEGFALLRWPALFVVTAIFLTLLNRYGPSRPTQRARWAIWGSVFGAAVWLIVSSIFSYYLAHFGNYAATYGSLATIAGLMMWLWISALVVLVGVELNVELEQRTARWEAEREYAEAIRRREAILEKQNSRTKRLSR
ncbi:YihY/virulence factor BrkB family protein [Roseiarcaceae bacterium H3SJ34-1]|uniref:YihY/virulence factor BrkB family protein n=1 Tax=Terripilifer ovatus TaxID=3032367 RepID=UPI003AB92AF5|nr:YihY/virulence factor BrkB family protein [Roseiarcaceae bacterium H3SJ34-1]